MAQARKRSKAARGKRLGSRAWTLVLLGIGIGAAVVLLWQLAMRHADPKGGLAGLRARITQSPDKPSARDAPAKPTTETAKSAKYKYDFYIILQEGESLVSERDLAKSKAATKSSKTEEGVHYYLQAGSFAHFEDADQLKARLALSGLVAQIQKVAIEGRGVYHRVRLGPYAKVEDMDQANRELKALGIKALASKTRANAT
jgi:cell division protein FtsN